MGNLLSFKQRVGIQAKIMKKCAWKIHKWHRAWWTLQQVSYMNLKLCILEKLFIIKKDGIYAGNYNITPCSRNGDYDYNMRDG